MHVHVHIGTVADCVFISNLRQRTKKIRISVWIPLPLHLQSSCDSITLTFFDISVYILHKSDEHISQFARPMPREQTRRKHSHTLIHAQYTYLTAYIQSSAKKKKKKQKQFVSAQRAKMFYFPARISHWNVWQQWREYKKKKKTEFEASAWNRAYFT